MFLNLGLFLSLGLAITVSYSCGDDYDSSQYTATTQKGSQCAATTQKGEQCKRNADEGSIYCWQHK